jgi:hypothetical protein
MQARGIAYFAFGSEAFTTAIAEAFQAESGAGVSPVNGVTGNPTITKAVLKRTVNVLDLNSSWVTRAKGNQSIRTGPRKDSREWTRAIYDAHITSIEGLAYSSSVYGPGRCVALFEMASDVLRTSPELTRQLNDAVMETAVRNALHMLNTYMLP